MKFKILQNIKPAGAILRNKSASLPRVKCQKSQLLYSDVYADSLANPEKFWTEQANKLIWEDKWKQTLNTLNSPFNQWFVGGRFSACYNALDRHVEEGYGDQLAIIHDSPMLGTNAYLTFNQLHEKVSKLAHVLKRYGVAQGDRVLIYMPMIPEAVVAMLAVIRIGAIHSLVFGGFGAKELALRIKHAEPKIILTATYGLEPNKIIPYKPIMDQSIKLSGVHPAKCIIYQRPNTSAKITGETFTNTFDVDWESEIAHARHQDCIPMAGEAPLYILYTSGTTGAPKGIVRPSAGYACALKWSMEHIYATRPGEVYWAASDLGWVVGHSYACYGPLLNRNTTIIYEGKPISTPDASAYFRVIDQYKAVSLFVAPTALRAIRREDPEAEKGQKYNLDSLRGIFLAGEHCDYETVEWTSKHFRVPVVDHWWQTETGWPVTSTFMGLRDDDYNGKPGEFNIPRGTTGKPVPGWNIELQSSFTPQPQIKSQSEPPVSLNQSKEASIEHAQSNKNENESIDESDQNQAILNASEPGEEKLGRILIKLPLPPGFMSTLWKGDQQYKDLYFKNYPGYYDTYDAGKRDANNFVSVMSRIDDVINVAGHRLSTGAIEEAILVNQDLAECAVIAVPDSLKGHVPLALCVPKHDIAKEESAIATDTINCVRDVIGPVACLKLVAVVHKLPKTRSGKISRHTMAALAINKPFDIPITLEDPKVYNEIRDSLQRLGYAKGNTRIF